jgi:tetratricopeptide (TPR) repeat protein
LKPNTVQNNPGGQLAMNFSYTGKCLVSLCLSLAILVPAGLAKEKKGPWDDHIEAGRNALHSGDFDSADRYMKQAMEDTRKFKDDDVRLGTTFFQMGELNVRQQNYSLAKEYYERALAVQQKLLGAESLEAADTLYGIALCYQQMGDHLAAEIFLKRVDEIWRKKLVPRDPKLLSILPSMAAYAAMKNNLASSEAYYKELVGIAQASGNQSQLGNYMNLLATTLGNEGKFDDAKDYAARAVDLLKKSSDSAIAIDSAQDNLRIIQSRSGDAKSVAAARAEAAKLQEQERIAAEKREQEDKARLAAEQSKRQSEQTRLAAEQAQAAEKARQAAEQARIAAEQAKAAEKARLAAEHRAAEQAQQTEQAQKAAQARIAAEKAEQEAKKTRLASEEAKRQSEQKQKEVMQQRVRIAEETKQEDNKRKPWQTDRAIKKAQAGESPQWGKVRYLSEGRLITAEEYKALLLANEAYESMRQEKYRMAVDILNKALDLCPELPSAHTNIGLALARVGKPEEAIEHLQISIALDPSRSAPWVNLASSFQTTGRLKDCVETYKEYLRRFPNDSLAQKAADLVKHLQGEADEQEAVEKAIATAKESSGNDYFPFTTATSTVKWKEDRMPLKVYIASGSRVPGYKSEYQGVMSDSFKSWSSASRDRIKFDYVNSADKADIDCLWTNDSSQVSSISEGGEAQVQFSPEGIKHVKVVILTADPTPDSPLTQNQVQAVCLHEIGHSLGLIGHSPKPNDIMFCSLPAADSRVALSQRDIGTIRHLYAPDVQIAMTPRIKRSVDPLDKHSVNNEGVEFMSTRAYEQAIAKFEEALKIDPDYEPAKENLSSAYNNYALDLMNKGKEQEAETLMQKAMKLQSSIRSVATKLKISTMHNYALVLRKLHRDSEADKVEAESRTLQQK